MIQKQELTSIGLKLVKLAVTRANNLLLGMYAPLLLATNPNKHMLIIKGVFGTGSLYIFPLRSTFFS